MIKCPPIILSACKKYADVVCHWSRGVHTTAAKKKVMLCSMDLSIFACLVDLVCNFMMHMISTHVKRQFST